MSKYVFGLRFFLGYITIMLVNLPIVSFHLKAGTPCINKGTIPKGFNRKSVDRDGKPRVLQGK